MVACMYAYAFVCMCGVFHAGAGRAAALYVRTQAGEGVGRK